MLATIENRVLRAGIKGQCDLYAIERGGRHFEIELKGPTGSLRPEQRLWKEFCEFWGVSYMLLRMNIGESAESAASRWCDEISQKLSSCN